MGSCPTFVNVDNFCGFVIDCVVEKYKEEWEKYKK